MMASIVRPSPELVLTGPAWASTAAATALGDRWPAGDETATWDVADRWYALASALTVPRMSAFAAADQILSGLIGAGIAPDGFREAWERLSGGDDAPLNALVQIAAELGQMVEECGREIEQAKLEALIEVATLLTELVALPIAIELTLGAAGAAAEGLITASRVAVEHIYDRLASRLGGEHATRTRTADPAHSARSDQRTIRLPIPTGKGDRRAGAAAFEADTASAEIRPPVEFGDDLAATGGETRRLTRAELLRSLDDGVTTRRLAPRPRTGDQEGGEATRRLVAPAASRPASGRPTIPLQRATGPARVDEYADHLTRVAETIRANLAVAGPDPVMAAFAEELEAEASLARTRPSPQLDPAPAWARPEPDERPPGPEITAAPGSQRDRAAGDDDPPVRSAMVPAIDKDEFLDRPGWAQLDERTTAPGSTFAPAQASGWPRSGRERGRPAEEQAPGGLRRAYGVHLKALRDAVPTASHGPDPRVGRWFSLVNAGGPETDPTRGVNCLDAVLALFETYHRGRPRVAAARTFDGYAHGAPDRPVGGEWGGVRRIQRAARAEFQNLCPFVGGASAGQAEEAVEAAFRNLANHLHNSGHGAFAFILTDFSTGGCHAWAAVNQDGTILFLDPQLGLVSDEEPLYRDVVSMDALVVGGDGEPAPLPYHGAGQWTVF
jgi:hypothetical protein